MVRVVPEGVFFNSLESRGGKFSVDATAERNNNVSDLMRRLDSSTWFSDPNLTGISADRRFGEYASSFKLSFDLDMPELDNSEAKK